MKKQFLSILEKNILLCDGGMGSLLQNEVLDLEKDFLWHENCSEILTKTRPDIIANIHRKYFQAGADCVETNTFGANKIVLKEFGLENQVYELNFKAAKLAREVANEFDTEKFVIGSIGPGTKLPSLGQVTYDALVDSYQEQVRGLVAGEVDLLLLETNQDLLTIKAAIHACKSVTTAIPIFVQVTVEQSGATLVGSNIACVVTTIAAMDVAGIGLNCGLGPLEMAEHVKYISQSWPGYISVMPNAGLPMVINGETKYLLKPEELAAWHEKFIRQFGVNLVGGCCGTTPEHIAAVREMLDSTAIKRLQINKKLTIPGVSSLFDSVSYKQESSFFAIGERANANGAKKFRELLLHDDIEGMVKVAKAQEKEGAFAIDVCVAYAGRNELNDITTLLTQLRGQVKSPIVIDSTDAKVIQSGLKLLGGKSIINSINFESGDSKAKEILIIAKQFGAAVIGLTIDENGMAKTVADKVKIAKRLYELAVNKFNLPAEDLFVDPLTFTICTGNAEDRDHAINTLEAIKQIAKQCPKCQILLGLSNISFGLKPKARQALNSVFIEHAKLAGMTAAIVHAAKIIPLYNIPTKKIKAAEDLIFNKMPNALINFISLFEDDSGEQKVKKTPVKIEDILINKIIDGDKSELEKELEIALKKHSPLEIINSILLQGMQQVGDLFSAGKTQLPFVLQSAETMNAAVQYLQKYIKHEKIKSKGTFLLATVQGDVHDIGKNLVDIILSNNGYNVINIGIKQTINQILAAIDKYKPDYVGMSGLLVKSTLIMRDNLETMKQQKIKIPVLLGGAALTRKFVEEDCRRVYGDDVYYAGDAFAAIKIIEKI